MNSARSLRVATTSGPAIATPHPVARPRPCAAAARRRPRAAAAARDDDDDAGPAPTPSATSTSTISASASSPPTTSWAFASPPQRVRDYELDAFNVVNNGVYASFFQDARHLALERMTGASVGAYLERGVLMALSELVIRYRAPLRSGDWYVCRVGVAEVKGTRVTLAQQVVRVAAAAAEGGGGGNGGNGGGQEGEGEETEEEVLAAEGSATVVFLDKRYRPARMPAEAKRAFEAAAAAAARGG